MPISKRVLVIGAAGFAASMSSMAIAQTKAKSKSVAQLGEGVRGLDRPQDGRRAEVQHQSIRGQACKPMFALGGVHGDPSWGRKLPTERQDVPMPFEAGARGTTKRRWANFQDRFSGLGEPIIDRS